MKKAILARKLGMTQIFTDTGTMIPVTVLEAGPCVVTQIKTLDKEGYNAVQVGFVDAKAKKMIKPKKGHFDKNSIEPKKYLREFRIDDLTGYEVGKELKADVFADGDRVDISGTSKGKGTQGPIRRHNYSRGPETHGSKYHRGGGALSAGTDPGKVPKGRKMAGRMGNERVTVQNLTVVRIDPEKNVIIVKGAVPGNKGSLLIIKDSVKV